MTSSNGAPPADPASAEGADPAARSGMTRVLWLSTVAFTLMFAVWLEFGVLGIPIQKEFGLTDSQLAWISAVAILNGSIWRLPLGVLADRVGGRVVTLWMLVAVSVPAMVLAHADLSYTVILVLAFLIGFAGNLFSVGVAWVAAWYPAQRQGFALGVFGAGNVGASVTKFIGPPLIVGTAGATYLGGVVPGGWRFVPALYALLLIAMAIAVVALAPRADQKPGQSRPLGEMLRPLKQMRVWRFSLYYVVVFGAYVALAAWLPKYYVSVYGLELSSAALLTALFIFPASLLRPLGGWLSDRFGPRRVMYWMFGVMITVLVLLAAPFGYIVLQTPEGPREVLPYSLGVVPFTLLLFVLAVTMGIGKGAVFKYIPEYFPHDVGAVGGLVGTLGALGGFFLLPLFVAVREWTGLPQSTFIVLLALTVASFLWMHVTVHRMLHRAAPELSKQLESDPAPETSTPSMAGASR